MVCSQRCIYYPANPAYVTEVREHETHTERNAIFLCQYDDHRIKEFVECPFYKERVKGDILD